MTLRHWLIPASLFCACCVWCDAAADQRGVIRIDTTTDVHQTSPYLTGACIEDVNHEIYGGLYSQMIFGESFQEPADSAPAAGFAAYGDAWRVDDGVIGSPVGDGNKLVADAVDLADGTVSVEVRFSDASHGNAGLIVRTSRAGRGLDQFDGYEVALDPERQIVRLGRHRQDFTLLQDAPCQIAIGEWVKLSVRLSGAMLEVFVDGVQAIRFNEKPADVIRSGSIGLRQFHRHALYRNLTCSDATRSQQVPFIQPPSQRNEVSRMWTAVSTRSAQGSFALDTVEPFVGQQSQRVEHIGGDGEVGVCNRGLNRWGLAFLAGKPYEGEVYLKASSPCDVWIALQADDGAQTLAETHVRVSSDQWTKHVLALTPRQNCRGGRFTISLRDRGAVNIGYASLHPGAWGRFADLPVRRDVAEMLQQQRITMLRYGGSMVNEETYRWKNMIGPRAERPPYDGHWYDYSTNGWGILDFMDFCEAAGFEYVPTFSIGESPESMAQFVEYATGDASSVWGRKRIAHGHPAPYRLKYLQLGNEERVDEDYARRFIERARAIWKVNASITPIVGDFVYNDVIDDPQRVTGAASGLSNLNGQRQILEFAKAAGREVWIDLHVWSGGPGLDGSLAGMKSFIDALEAMDTGAAFRVVVFELNANNHSHRRAIGNALAMQAIERDGRIPVALSANGLQPDAQNDNGWNQGLLFLSPSNVWLQPPGYVTQLFSRYYQPRLVGCTQAGAAGQLSCTAKLGQQRDVLTCCVVNSTSAAIDAAFLIKGFSRRKKSVEVAQLAAPLDAVNTEEHMTRVTPSVREWTIAPSAADLPFRFEPHSVTFFEFR